MRLISTNFTQESQTVTTASSSNTNYPVSNIAHQFRSKEWRSNATGNFVVDATNNKINFNEGAAELTSTITSGTYTSTTLATEIKTQLEAAGAATFTVTFSSTTGKWTIVSNGATFQLLNNTGTNQAVSLLKVALGFANTDRTGTLTYTGSNIAIHTEEWIVFDVLTTEDMNSVALLWPKEDGITLSDSAVVKIQANATNVWTSPAVSVTLAVDDTFSIYSYYWTAVQSYRYWRVLIVDPTNPNLYVNLGVCVLGKGESIQTVDNGFKLVIKDNSKITETDYGNRYIDVYPTTSTLSLPFSVLSIADILVLESIYISNGIRIPVFITIDETGAVYDKDQFAIYGHMKSNLDIGHINYDLFNTDLVIEEIV